MPGGQDRTVRGHGQIGEPDSTEPGDEVGHTAGTSCRPGQTHRVDPETVRDQGNPLDLLEREDPDRVPRVTPSSGIPVDATEVATVGYRDPELYVEASAENEAELADRSSAWERFGALR